MLSQEESAEDVKMMRTAQQDALRTVVNLSSGALPCSTCLSKSMVAVNLC